MTIEIEAGASQSQYSTKRCTLPTSHFTSRSENLLLNRARLSGHRNYGGNVIDMTQLRKLEEQVAAWPHVSVHPHRFGGREFRFGNAELGHVHLGGTVDIPLPPRRSLCAQDGQRRSRNAGARERRAWPESPSPVPAPTAPAHTARTHYH